jgi:uncharacterized protein YdbL (DUF1318 family)
MKFTRRQSLHALLALPIVSFISLPTAFAASLDELRAAGKVGERYDGTAVALSNDAKSTVENVNKERRKIYEEKAAEQGVAVEAVGRVYAEQIMKKAPAGTKFQKQDGTWVTK